MTAPISIIRRIWIKTQAYPFSRSYYLVGSASPRFLLLKRRN